MHKNIVNLNSLKPAYFIFNDKIKRNRSGYCMLFTAFRDKLLFYLYFIVLKTSCVVIFDEKYYILNSGIC